MVLFTVFLFCSWTWSACAVNLTFPPYFQFGVATAAYQIEGAWNHADKGESIWDEFTHKNPDAIADKTNGDRACDSYHYWKRDVDMIKDLNAHFYRFSISWPRLLPTGYPNQISKDGKNYYNNLIDALLELGIKPIVTLYHWDLPVNLQKIGGWTNPEIVERFMDYATVAFSLFGDRVKNWITINEPLIMCDLSYVTGSMAPGIREPIHAPYLCNKNVLLAHASAYRAYHQHFSHNKGCSEHGMISIANHLVYFYPQSDDDRDITDLLLQYFNGRYLYPIYSEEGGWPKSIEKLIRETSKNQGYKYSRLPDFTEEEIELIKGTYDFFAFNYYTSRMVSASSSGGAGLADLVQISGLKSDLIVPPNSTIGFVADQIIYPEGIRGILNWLKKNYGDLNYFITENGYSSGGYNLKDEPRINYIRDHLKQIWLAINNDKINVSGYTYWSLMDNFEWASGYQPKFGLYETDYQDDSLKRTPRESAVYYTKVVFSLYADRVKTWLTINEPVVMCDITFNTGMLAPPILIEDVGAYICNKNTMIAHAKAWRIYDEQFRPLYKGEVALANHLFWFDPLTSDDEDIAEAARENMVY